MDPILTERSGPSYQPPEYIVPGCFARYPELVALQSTRTGGVSTGAYFSLNLGNNTGDNPDVVRQNTQRLCSAAGIDPERLVSSTQVHGTEILNAVTPGRYEGYDAFITNRNDLFLSIFTADCFPVLLFDPRHHAVAAVHAGWQGCAGRIVIKTINAMEKAFGSIPGECIAYIGTGISGKAYEVGPEVAEKFEPDCCRLAPQLQGENKYLLDLGRVNYNQLIASGVLASNIEHSRFCTLIQSDLFYSYRRDNGKTGRMVTLIGIRSPGRAG
jgi:hypothetical protein